MQLCKSNKYSHNNRPNLCLLLFCFLRIFLCQYTSAKSSIKTHIEIEPKNDFLDMNFGLAHKKGFNGENITIGIIDSYLDVQHPDIKNSFNEKLAQEFNFKHIQKNADINYGLKHHGTQVAGIIAGEPKSFICSQGLAYKAKIALIGIEFDIKIEDFQEALAIGHKNDEIDIYVTSWGTTDDGKSIGGPQNLAAKSLAMAAHNGRRGLGNIFVVASGNGGVYDDCNCDGFVSSLHTISVGMYDQDSGARSYFQEHCAAMLTFVPNTLHKMITATLREVSDSGCTTNFTGTSAAAPVLASAIALALQSNKELKFRDIEHLIVKSAKIPLNFKPKVFKNAAGLQFSPYAGFGVLDTAKMVSLAKNWSRIPKIKRCVLKIAKRKMMKASSEAEIVFSSKNCMGRINRVEKVVLEFSAFVAAGRGSLSIDLISESKTKSRILSRRTKDIESKIFDSVKLKDVHFWNETVNGGNWVTIFKSKSLVQNYNAENGPNSAITNIDCQLILYGYFDDQT